MIDRYKFLSGLFFGAMWALLTFGFISEELLPPLASLRSLVFFLCDTIFLVLGIYSLRNKRDIFVVVTFLFIGITSCVLNHIGLLFGLNGARDFFGLLFAVPICRLFLTSKYRERFIESFDKQLLIFLIIQAFCMTWQFVRYGANDHGGGCMGFGFSGIASTLIYIISFYLISKRWKYGNYWGEMVRNKLYFFLLYPTFLNETKISFVFLLAYFLLLLPFEWKTALKILISLPIMIGAMVGIGIAYLFITGQSVESVFTQAAMDDYLIGEDPEELLDLAQYVQDGTYDIEDIGVLDIPRFTKIFFIPEALDDAEGGELWGAGLGQFKGGSLMELTPYAEKWNWVLSGSIPYLFFVMIQLGVLGLAWFLYTVATLFLHKSKVFMGLNIKLFILLIFSLIMTYNDSLRFFPFCAIIFYILIVGYVNCEDDVESKPVLEGHNQ